ncbi:MAG: hypothetical protein IIB45_11705, partial [Candidatus Marinimicrobia bacterium]|nr:hypothetical protein [Candidatus Neomarinimicrobiota bacterium]
MLPTQIQKLKLQRQKYTSSTDTEQIDNLLAKCAIELIIAITRTIPTGMVDSACEHYIELLDISMYALPTTDEDEEYHDIALALPIVIDYVAKRMMLVPSRLDSLRDKVTSPAAKLYCTRLPLIAVGVLALEERIDSKKASQL